MKPFKIVIALSIFLSSALSYADNVAQERLIERLENYSSLSAEFTQVTYQDNQQTSDAAIGNMQIAKPLKFSWVVERPFEQQVISDGQNVWVYDPDLEQATYQSVEAGLAQSPAMILAEPRLSLENQYVVDEAGNEALTVFRLTPIAEDTLFSQITLFFERAAISEIRIQDTLGQETVIQLSNVVLDAAINDEQFTFNPPEGTDVFEQM